MGKGFRGLLKWGFGPEFPACWLEELFVEVNGAWKSKNGDRLAEENKLGESQLIQRFSPECSGFNGDFAQYSSAF
jgi:hypothetical protein